MSSANGEASEGTSSTSKRTSEWPSTLNSIVTLQWHEFKRGYPGVGYLLRARGMVDGNVCDDSVPSQQIRALTMNVQRRQFLFPCSAGMEDGYKSVEKKKE